MNQNLKVKEPLLHLPLERYRQRYTELLHDWEREEFGKRFKVDTVEPEADQTLLNISSGEVLDSTSRPVWCMEQIKQLLLRKPGPLGKIWVSDFYHTGLDALKYARRSFKAYSFCWAQTFDQYDFTVAFKDWMRPWEFMAFNIYSDVFVACEGLKELIGSAMPNVDHVHAVGLPFNSKMVADKIDLSKITGETYNCVYSSRWDREKRPGMFLDLVERRDDLKFVVCTGWSELRGTDDTAILRAQRLEAQGRLVIRRQLSKGEYYGILSQTDVQFNCALQDWVSFTLLEALTFGCHPLYPNFRSFPETLVFDEAALYNPYRVEDAVEKISALVGPKKRVFPAGPAILEYHDGTLNRIARKMEDDR